MTFCCDRGTVNGCPALTIDQRLIQSSKSCLECLRWCLVGPSELSSGISSGFIFSGYNYFMYQRKGGEVKEKLEQPAGVTGSET